MKKVFYLLTLPIIYSTFMIYKSPTLPDALILASLCAMVGYLAQLFLKYSSTKNEDKELGKLERELQLEKLKLNIDQIKENALRDKQMRDARNALTGYKEGKEIRF